MCHKSHKWNFTIISNVLSEDTEVPNWLGYIQPRNSKPRIQAVC